MLSSNIKPNLKEFGGEKKKRADHKDRIKVGFQWVYQYALGIGKVEFEVVSVPPMVFESQDA